MRLPSEASFSYDEFTTVNLDVPIDTPTDDLIDMEGKAYDEAFRKLESKYGYHVDDFAIFIYPTTRTVECSDIQWFSKIRQQRRKR